MQDIERLGMDQVVKANDSNDWDGKRTDEPQIRWNKVQSNCLLYLRMY